MLPISPHDHVFILTAGVSAESGTPTFRGVNGLWRNYRIEEVASPHAWTCDPRLVWEFYSMRRRVAAEANPNPAHFALAKLEQKLQDRLFLCTQNVDDLHEQAGSMRVVHMHGELFKSRCDRCTRPPFHDTPLTILQRSFPGASAVVGFARTSAGLARFRSNWIASSVLWTNASISSPWARRAWSNPPPVSWLTLPVVRGRSTWESKSLQMYPRSRNAIWGRRERYCPISFVRCARNPHLSGNVCNNRETRSHRIASITEFLLPLARTG